MNVTRSNLVKAAIVAGVLVVGTSTLSAPAMAQTDTCAQEADAYCSAIYTPGTEGYWACRHAKLLDCANSGG